MSRFYLQHLRFLLCGRYPLITMSTIFCCIRWPPELSGIKCMRNAMLPKFPGSKFCTLVPGPCLINPDMKRNSLFVSQINRGGCCSIIDVGKPAGIAMGKNIYRFSLLFFTDGFQSASIRVSLSACNFPFPFHRFQVLLSSAVSDSDPEE